MKKRIHTHPYDVEPDMDVLSTPINVTKNTGSRIVGFLWGFTGVFLMFASAFLLDKHDITIRGIVVIVALLCGILFHIETNHYEVMNK